MITRICTGLTLASILLFANACSTTPEHDIIIRGGSLYDGSGAAPVVTDLAIDGDQITQIGNLNKHSGRSEIDAT